MIGKRPGRQLPAKLIPKASDNRQSQMKVTESPAHRAASFLIQPTGSNLLLLFAVLLYALAVRRGDGMNGALVLPATAAMAVAAWMRLRHSQVTEHVDPDQDTRWHLQLMVAVVLLGLIGAVGWSGAATGPSAIGAESPALERLPGLAWVLLAVVAFVFRKAVSRVVPTLIVVATLAFTLFIGLLHLSAAEGVGLDVYLLHAAAADALAAGVNPYTDAVEVPDGAPTAEPGAVITGYVYPPVTAVAYALGEWTLSDARYTSLAAWLVVLGLVGVSALRNRHTSGILLMLLLAAVPGWPLVLRAAWTEPVSLAFLVAAFFLWARPAGSGAGIGLALASKQYFLVAAPLILLHRDLKWKTRLVVAAVTIIATVGVALAWNAGAFWSSAIDFHTTTPPRLDSGNIVGVLGLVGVTWNPPTVLALGAGLIAATIAGRLSRNRGTFMLALGLALALSFLVTSQAFANYWFLVVGLGVLTLRDKDDPRHGRLSRNEVHS